MALGLVEVFNTVARCAFYRPFIIDLCQEVRAGMNWGGGVLKISGCSEGRSPYCTAYIYCHFFSIMNLCITVSMSIHKTVLMP